MPNQTSTIATAQTNALAKGAGRGSHSPQSVANLRIFSDKVVLPVGTLANSEYARFGKVPQGAVIYPTLSMLSTNHTANIPGKLQLVPLDGSAAQDITGVSANLEATTTTSIASLGADVTVLKTSWVQFVPTSNTTIATTDKDLRLRLVYGQTY
ncbi:MAG: hypothetical protein EOP88_13760 [Verrucomicrobiaceae bacterium]|nr:MAG: hypothetical protein EOP88_13760 [Verrucomicrobiaceae bacterium]